MGKNSNGKQILAEASHSGLHKVVLELEGKVPKSTNLGCSVRRSILLA
jgi:hypothetical protein